MSIVNIGFSVRSIGVLVAGLTPVWLGLYKLSDGSAVSSPDSVAPITEIGSGLYKIAYDPEGANGELYGVIDAGASVTADQDRYPDILLAQDSSRVQRLDATTSSRASQASVDALPEPGQVYRLLSTPLRSGRTESVIYTRGAGGPDLLDHIEDGEGARIDLTDYTITASLIKMGTGAVVFEDEDGELGNAPDEGQVVLAWPEGALDTPGQYRLIWRASKSGEDDLLWNTLVTVE